jgi:MFS family permease
VVPPDPAPSAWLPLRRPVFRALWIATLFSNLGTWVHGVGAAWLMTTLAPSPPMVAGVQAATALPMFLLALPAGALADVLDRRRILLASQGWMLVASAILGVLTQLERISPAGLLVLIFLMGVGAALNGPPWQAIVPALVPAPELPAAVTLNSISFNIARAVGPAVGGLLVAAAGPGPTFLLNAASFLGVMAVLYRWRRPPSSSVLPAERFLGAMRTGLRYVRHAPEVQAILLRGGLFLSCASALWALLPLVARQRGAGPAGYGLLLGCLGTGAVLGALLLPRLRHRAPPQGIVAAATLAFAAMLFAAAFERWLPLLAAALVIGGAAWLSLLSSLNVALQTVIPEWVRGRALAVYMVVFFGAMSAGSLLWGAVAERVGLAGSLAAAGVGLLAGLAVTARLPLASGEGLDLAPSRQWPAPVVAYEFDREVGPVLVTVEYLVPAEKAERFAAAMAEMRRIRLRDGALQWGLFVDAADPERQVEVFLVKSWLEHLRQHERVTFADLVVQQRARAFHAGSEPPAIRHLIAAPPVPAAPAEEEKGTGRGR